MLVHSCKANNPPTRTDELIKIAGCMNTGWFLEFILSKGFSEGPSTLFCPGSGDAQPADCAHLPSGRRKRGHLSCGLVILIRCKGRCNELLPILAIFIDEHKRQMMLFKPSIRPESLRTCLFCSQRRCQVTEILRERTLRRLTALKGRDLEVEVGRLWIRSSSG